MSMRKKQPSDAKRCSQRMDNPSKVKAHIILQATVQKLKGKISKSAVASNVCSLTSKRCCYDGGTL